MALLKQIVLPANFDVTNPQHFKSVLNEINRVVSQINAVYDSYILPVINDSIFQNSSMILNSEDTLTVVLSGPVATTEPVFFSTFLDLSSQAFFVSNNYKGTTNGTTPVVVVPRLPYKRQVRCFNLYNRDSASVVATIALNSGTNSYPLFTQTLAPGDSLFWSKEAGWQ